MRDGQFGRYPPEAPLGSSHELHTTSFGKRRQHPSHCCDEEKDLRTFDSSSSGSGPNRSHAPPLLASLRFQMPRRAERQIARFNSSLWCGPGGAKTIKCVYPARRFSLRQIRSQLRSCRLELSGRSRYCEVVQPLPPCPLKSPSGNRPRLSKWCQLQN